MNKELIFSNISAYCKKNHNFYFDEKNPIVRLHEPTFSAEEINAFVDQMLTTHVTMGKEVRKFEDQYSKTMGHKYGIMNNSGSSANLLAISALTNQLTKNNLRPGDEVIAPSLSWSTTIWPLIQHGLIPVLVDADPKTLNLDLNKLEKAITNKTRAIMLVHVYGNPCDMDGLLSLAKKYDLQIIEDSCESMGAYYNKQSVGSFGRIGTFSFYFSHHITTLEGGICVTNDLKLAETIRIMRAHGWSREADGHEEYVKKYPDIDPRFIFVNLGYNLRPTECQGRMGQIQLPKLADFAIQRRKNIAYYKHKLNKYSDIFAFQEEQEHGYASWFGMAITLKNKCPFGIKEITSYLKSKNIENRPIIAGNIGNHPVMQDYRHIMSGNQDASNNIMKNGFALGCHQHINEVAIDYVISNIEEFIHK